MFFLHCAHTLYLCLAVSLPIVGSHFCDSFRFFLLFWFFILPLDVVEFRFLFFLLLNCCWWWWWRTVSATLDWISKLLLFLFLFLFWRLQAFCSLQLNGIHISFNFNTDRPISILLWMWLSLSVSKCLMISANCQASFSRHFFLLFLLFDW